jgi:hypothetical protein
MLIKEKVEQARALLDEFDIDCWITFVRESQLNGDPSLAFLAPGHVTWHSAFIVPRGGRTRAIVGRYDVRSVEDCGAWDEVVGFVTGVREPLIEYLGLGPRRSHQSPRKRICDSITHGMFLTLQRYLPTSGWPTGWSLRGRRVGSPGAQDPA